MGMGALAAIASAGCSDASEGGAPEAPPADGTPGSGPGEELAKKKTACNADVDCDDGNSCSADRWEGGLCVYTPLENGLACDDGNPCTASDVCKGGDCKGRGKDANGLACDDENSCKAGDTRSKGTCSGNVLPAAPPVTTATPAR